MLYGRVVKSLYIFDRCRVGETVLGQGTVLGHFDLSGYVTYIITDFLHFFWHKRKVPCLGTMLILNRLSELYK